MKRSMRTVGAAALLATALAGCASGAPESAPAGQPTPPATSAATSPATSGATGQLLAAHGLSGLSTKQIIDKLDRTNDDRSSGLVGSVRPDQLQLSDGASTATMGVPADSFYLSVAPYVTRTHDCFNHNLATCQGELVGKQVAVKVVDSAGKVLVEETTQTYPNGFVGFWLPRDVTGTIEVSAEGRSGKQPIRTAADSPTCLTTLRLT